MENGKHAERTYIAIDLKSFYASVECAERGLDPLDTNLAVADPERTEKTICLAVSPSLKEYGIPGRPRLFEVMQKVSDANAERRRKAPGGRLSGESCSRSELEKNAALAISFVTAVPRMALYTKYSTDIYGIYLKYVASEDIHVYSIDEVFMDVTEYLKACGMSARELTSRIISDVFDTTGITATAGIGTNMYLCKIAMDIMAKKMEPDKNGVRIAYLDEMTYRRELWNHTPLTDFWRIGQGYFKKLEEAGLHTMGDIARCSLSEYGEDKLYRMFGVNAELLIDHAWGWEPCTIADVKAYKPQSSSISSGQVLHCPYSFDKARLIVKEMTELMALELVDKGLVTNQLVLTVGYDTESLAGAKGRRSYKGELTEDRYRRIVPKPAHGSESLGRYTASTRLMLDAMTALYDRITDKDLLVRRINIVANHVLPEGEAEQEKEYVQLDLFTDYEQKSKEEAELESFLEKEKSIQRAMLDIKKKFGKNAILKGMNLEEGATTVDRNNQIGGHRK